MTCNIEITLSNNNATAPGVFLASFHPLQGHWLMMMMMMMGFPSLLILHREPGTLARLPDNGKFPRDDLTTL